MIQFCGNGYNNLLNPLITAESNDYLNKTIWNTDKVNKSFQSLLLFCKLQLKETGIYKLAEIHLNNLETFLDELFVVEDTISIKFKQL